jgi:transcription elongation factor Elf1
VSKQILCWDELATLLSKAQFPNHYLVVRPDDEYHLECRKRIETIESLREAYDWATNLSKKENVFVENDLGAHTNPTRMSIILKATQDLAKKMTYLCPECEAPGFSTTENKKGLCCSRCGVPTNLPIANIWWCMKCGHKKEVATVDQTHADPSRCNYSNP